MRNKYWRIDRKTKQNKTERFTAIQKCHIVYLVVAPVYLGNRIDIGNYFYVYEQRKTNVFALEQAMENIFFIYLIKQYRIVRDEYQIIACPIQVKQSMARGKKSSQINSHSKSDIISLY